jgi:hypothetical protein
MKGENQMFLSMFGTVFGKAEIIGTDRGSQGQTIVSILLDGRKFEYPQFFGYTKAEALEKCREDYHIALGGAY